MFSINLPRVEVQLYRMHCSVNVHVRRFAGGHSFQALEQLCRVPSVLVPACTDSLRSRKKKIKNGIMSVLWRHRNQVNIAVSFFPRNHLKFSRPVHHHFLKYCRGIWYGGANNGAVPTDNTPEQECQWQKATTSTQGLHHQHITFKMYVFFFL